jgi:hypothetical protein
MSEPVINDMTTLGAELHDDLLKQRKIAAFFAVVALAEGILILCFGIGQMFF